MSSNPFYSVGTILIDTQGKTERCAIQLLGDSIVISGPLDCKDNITISGDLNITGDLDVNRLSWVNSAVTLTADEVIYPSVNDFGVLKISKELNINNGDIEIDNDIRHTLNINKKTYMSGKTVEMSMSSVTLGNNSTHGYTNVTGNVNPVFTYHENNQSFNIGSVWFLSGHIEGNSDVWTWAAGTNLFYNDSSSWYAIYNSRRKYVELHYSGFSFDGASASMSGNIYCVPPAYKFTALTPIHVDGTSTFGFWAIRTA